MKSLKREGIYLGFQFQRDTVYHGEEAIAAGAVTGLIFLFLYFGSREW